MDRKERLEFLKNVKREEIKKLVVQAREQLGIESEEYDKAKCCQAEVEMEIMELENISDKAYWQSANTTEARTKRSYYRISPGENGENWSAGSAR